MSPPVFSVIVLAQSLVFCVELCGTLFVLFYSFFWQLDLPSIYGFWSPIWNLKITASELHTFQVLLTKKIYQNRSWIYLTEVKFLKLILLKKSHHQQFLNEIKTHILLTFCDYKIISSSKEDLWIKVKVIVTGVSLPHLCFVIQIKCYCILVVYNSQIVPSESKTNYKKITKNSKLFYHVTYSLGFGVGLGLGLWCIMPLSTISHWQTFSHNVVSSTPLWVGFELLTLVVIGTDCIGSYKSNYHMITAMIAPINCLRIL